MSDTLTLMDALDVDWLTAEHDGRCVSIFAPADAVGRDTEAQKLALKNQIADAQSRLVELGLTEAEADERLAPFGNVHEAWDRWRARAQGLALLVTPDEARVAPLRVAVEPIIMVAPRHVYALPLIARRESELAYALCLSQNRAKLVPVSVALEAGDDPQAPVLDLADGFEALGKFIDAERHLQFHTAGPSPQPTGGDRPAEYHGQGSSTDDAAVNRWLRDYCRLVDQAVRDALGDDEPTILLIAAEPMHSMYAHHAARPRLIADQPLGNFDHLADHEIRALAAPRITRDHTENNALGDLYDAAVGAGQAADDLEAIVVAAIDGRVDRLLVRDGARQWGRFDPNTREIARRDSPTHGDEDLLNLAALATRRQSGAVHLIQPAHAPMPTDAAALLRY